LVKNKIEQEADSKGFHYPLFRNLLALAVKLTIIASLKLPKVLVMALY